MWLCLPWRSFDNFLKNLCIYGCLSFRFLTGAIGIGGGKTAFIKLLCRLYDVEEVEILFMRENIRFGDWEMQKQAIARAIYMDVPVVIPDELIAALDSVDWMLVKNVLEWKRPIALRRNRMKLVICEDNKNEMEQTRKLLEQYGSLRGVKWEVSSFDSPLALCGEIDAGKIYDIFVLDILMPDMDGIQLGKIIRKKMPYAVIIYLTSSSDFALSSYSVYAHQYLLKPVEEELFFQTLDRVLRQRITVRKNWTVKTAAGVRNVLMEEIRYVEYINRTVNYYLCTDETVKSVSLRESFARAIEDLLLEQRFLKIAASFVVNMDYIKLVEKNAFVMDNGVKLVISRQKIQECRQQYLDYLLMGRENGYVV